MPDFRGEASLSFKDGSVQETREFNMRTELLGRCCQGPPWEMPQLRHQRVQLFSRLHAIPPSPRPGELQLSSLCESHQSRQHLPDFITHVTTLPLTKMAKRLVGLVSPSNVSGKNNVPSVFGASISVKSRRLLIS